MLRSSKRCSRRLWSTASSRPETSRTMRDQRQFALPDRFRRETQRLADIVQLELGKLMENLIVRLALGEHSDHRGDRNAQVANAGHAPAATRIHGNTCERHSLNRLRQRPYLLVVCERKSI